MAIPERVSVLLYGYCLVKHFARARNTSAESRSASRMCKVGIIHARFSGDANLDKAKGRDRVFH